MLAVGSVDVLKQVEDIPLYSPLAEFFFFFLITNRVNQMIFLVDRIV